MISGIFYRLNIAISRYVCKVQIFHESIEIIFCYLLIMMTAYFQLPVLIYKCSYYHLVIVVL